MSSPVVVNSVFDLQKSCPIDGLFDIRTNIPTRDCIDYIGPISWAPAKRAITAKSHRFILCGAVICAASLMSADGKEENPDPDHILLPSGQLLTALAVPAVQRQYLVVGCRLHSVAGGAMASTVSPDGKTLLVLTSGYTVGKSPQHIFVYDISALRPDKKQTIKIQNSFAGIAFSPNGQNFYVAGGKDDDIHIYSIRRNGSWAETEKPIPLVHNQGNGIGVPPRTAGLAVTSDGRKLVVANVYNDSVSIVDLATLKHHDLDLRPGKNDPSKSGVSGGEYPFGVVTKGNETVYVSSVRDREIVVLDITSRPKVALRIKTKGNPNQMILDRQQRFLYVAQDNSDSVAVIDTRWNKVVADVATAGVKTEVPEIVFRYRGSAPNSLALSPDGTKLYVTNGGSNSLAVIIGLPHRPRTIGLIPTGYYPNSVSISPDGQMLYVVNGKSLAGPNPDYLPVEPHPCRFTLKKRNNWQSVQALQRPSLLSFPVPDGRTLARLSGIVANNNASYVRPRHHDEAVMAALRRRINHVIYIIKENRTYDQILGDLERGNGDPRLTEFGKEVTPNFHNLARTFVDLDNFFDSGDVSGEGWPWSTAGRENDFTRRTVPFFYSNPNRGATYDFEGVNRKINVGWATVQQRRRFNCSVPCDPDVLPGTADVGALDGPQGTGPEKGYLWDAALRAGLTIRNYGCFCDSTPYEETKPDKTPVVPKLPYPAQQKRRVAFPTKSALMNNTDPFFRGFDNAYPDYYREWEWEREFDRFSKSGSLPNLEFVRLMHDHMGNFDNTAIDRVNCPELQQADNDYAVGRLVDKVAHSRYKSDTLIFIVEDDAQDGADHVDAHRSTTYVVGPYVRQNAVVTQRYTTVNLLRTIEDILGLQHLSIYTATRPPMTEVFDLSKREWTYDAVPSLFLYNTCLPIPQHATKPSRFPKPSHSAAYWAEKTAEFDFSKEDNLGNPEKFNRIIWQGLKENVPYPAERDGTDLRQDRCRIQQSTGLAN
jgi:DNA-binding beta-propeller fold protein YncE